MSQRDFPLNNSGKQKRMRILPVQEQWMLEFNEIIDRLDGLQF